MSEERLSAAAIEKRIISVIADHLGRDEDDIARDDQFQHDLEADSLDVVEMVMGLEEEFGIQIPDDDAAALVTVDHAFQYIKRRLASKTAQ